MVVWCFSTVPPPVIGFTHTQSVPSLSRTQSVPPPRPLSLVSVAKHLLPHLHADNCAVATVAIHLHGGVQVLDFSDPNRDANRNVWRKGGQQKPTTLPTLPAFRFSLERGP